MLRLTLLLAVLVPLRAQDLTGKWCAVSDPQDCVVLKQNGDAVLGTFLVRSTPVAEATGWSRRGNVAMGFRRLDNNQVATFNAVLDSSGRLISRTLNSDGRMRWNGIYSRAEGAPAAAARCGIPLEPGTDRYAADFKTVGTGDANACCIACEQDPKCRAFSWVASQNTCYLKSTAPPATSVAGITSGAKAGAPVTATQPRRCRLAIEDNTDRYASDFRTLRTDNPETCCMACEDDPKCRSFAWVISQQTCYLKSTAPPKTAASGIASGAK